MKRKNLLIIFFVWLLCTANQCNKENCHNKIPFINNSDKTLYVISNIYYPSDTLLPLKEFEEHIHKVLPNSVNPNCLTRRAKTCYEGYSKIMISIVDEQIMAITPLGVIISDYLVLRRYDLTPADLELLNWEIPYPPDERMKNMKMWPPYGSE